MSFISLKDSWGPGSWQDEPDHEQWIDPETDLDCMIHRGYMGALCGYVAVPPGHPCHGVDRERIHVNVHGGLTYSAFCDEGGELCHVPEPGRPAEVWWLGFDCGHHHDVVPHMDAAYPDLHFPGQTYRDIAFVRREVALLARQLVTATPTKETSCESDS